MRVLLTTIPAYGHFAPLVPLAEALVDAGHEVAVATAESFGDVVARSGFGHIPAGIAEREAIARLLERSPGFAQGFVSSRGAGHLGRDRADAVAG